MNWSLYDKDKVDEKYKGKYDPVTNMEIKEPLMNIKCGHVYEKANGIKLMSKPGMVCPVQGCDQLLKAEDMFAPEKTVYKTGLDSDDSE